MAVGTVTIKTEEEIDLIRQSATLVGKALGEASKLVAPGVSTLKLDEVAEQVIRDNGGIPAFKDYKQSPTDTPFPGTLCISINEEVVHGLPAEGKYLQDGDIVTLDCGVYMNGFYGDCAYTFAVGEVSSKKRRLMKVTHEALYKGLEKAVEGNFLGDVSNAIQNHVEAYGYSIVREMVGHSIGSNLHEPPEVRNYGKKRSGLKLVEGMTLAVEPMVNLGRRKIVVESDGWTIRTGDRSPSAHYEHTIVVRKSQCEILSSHDFIVNKI